MPLINLASPKKIFFGAAKLKANRENGDSILSRACEWYNAFKSGSNVMGYLPRFGRLLEYFQLELTFQNPEKM